MTASPARRWDGATSGSCTASRRLSPFVYRVAKRGRSYPWWYDNLYLSIFWLDMAGNSLNLYNSVEWWDHVPHFHGPGALSAVLMGVFGLPGLAAAGLSTILHVTLE